MIFFLNPNTNAVHAYDSPALQSESTTDPTPLNANEAAIAAAREAGWKELSEQDFADWQAAAQSAIEAVAAAHIPPAVTMRQARLVLLQAGLLPQIDKAIATMPSPQREAATIEWEYSSEVRRDGQLVASLGGALGLDDAQLDQLFKAAARL